MVRMVLIFVASCFIDGDLYMMVYSMHRSFHLLKCVCTHADVQRFCFGTDWCKFGT